MRSDAMAVGADDVALRDLSLKRGAVLQKDLAGAEVEQFLTWVAVIKIHGVRGKDPTTVQARDTSELTKPLKATETLSGTRSCVSAVTSWLVSQ